MNLNDMTSQARHEMARPHRVARGSQQRTSRMRSSLVRMNSPSRRPQLGQSLAEVDAFVSGPMRQSYQGFTPELA